VVKRAEGNRDRENPKCPASSRFDSPLATNAGPFSRLGNRSLTVAVLIEFPSLPVPKQRAFLVDRPGVQWCDDYVTTSPSLIPPPVINAALCIDGDAIDRFGSAMRHLVVGLVDQAVNVRLISDDPRVEQFQLGPVQTVRHPPLTWPLASRRLDDLLEALSSEAPTVVHALSAGSYRLGQTIASTFECDFVAQVSSLEDCEAAVRLDPASVGRFIAVSEPLWAALEARIVGPAQQTELVRPGVRAATEICCFDDAERIVTLVCTTPLVADGGIDKTLVAVSRLVTHGHDILLFLLGKGPQESSLRRLVRDRKLDAHVTFVHPGGDISQAIASADIYLNPREETAFHVDGLFAIGAGVCVVTMHSQVADHFRHGETAVVLHSVSADSLADALEGILADTAGARRLAQSGCDYVRQHHAMSAMADRTVAVYRQLVLNQATFSIKKP